ncbi:MAG: multicopper oxidase domain-containing protein [Acidobacteriota bacterium]|nr:multicopper oxidase domain-containing protein [Acidobacteriota bacterium]
MKRIVLVLSIILCVGLVWSPLAQAQVVQTPLDPAGIPKFVNNLPMLKFEPDKKGNWKGDIPVALGESITVSICEFKAKILPDGTVDTVTGLAVPNETFVWGYQIGDVCHPFPKHSYIGPVVVAERGTPTQMTFINQLGLSWNSNVPAYTQNTDQTMHWADPLNDEFNQCAKYLSMYGGAPVGECANNYVGPIGAAVHLHGGEIPPNLDGGPDSWFTFDGNYQGHGFYTREVDNIDDITLPNADFPAGVLVKNRPDGVYHRSEGDTWTANAPIDRATYVYPNTQEAANIWFHDHILGMTRLNVYAGIAGAYIITDPGATNPNLGQVTDLVPLVIQDRMFDTNGQLYLSGPGGNTTIERPYWVAEFIGDVAVVNGAAWPKMTVEPKRYRFLFLNGSNSVGYNLWLEDAATAAAGPPLWVIGTDGGFLDVPAIAHEPGFNPQDLNYPGPIVGDKLVLLPGERYEVIIDFTNHAGQNLVMANDAWNPYPFGGAPPIPQIMQFEVKGKVKSPGVVYDPATGASPRVGEAIVDLGSLAAAPDVYRQLTLNEVASPITGVPLEALLNNSKWDGLSVDETVYPHTILPRGDFTQSGDYQVPTYYSEMPAEGSMEVWDIINITADAHPIHLHLVQFQILERIPFDDIAYFDDYSTTFPGGAYLPGYGPPMNYNAPNSAGAVGGNPNPFDFEIANSARGPRRGPAAHEVGWKDTATMYPGEVTRIAVRFAPTDVPADAAGPLGYPFDPDDGHGYVWHCHILDHEDNEMMRPTEVLTNTDFTGRTFTQGTDY